MADFSFEEVGDILRALERLDCTYISLECGDLKLEVSRSSAGSPSVAERTRTPEPASRTGAEKDQPDHGDGAQEHPAPGGRATDIPDHWVAVVAPMVGTFYRAPGPDESPFVEVGDAVEPGRTVGIIEVMKLFTELKAEAAGKVARIDAQDAALVESSQPLVWIEPS